MTQPGWETLADELSRRLEGHRVTHALFTTYALDLEFFETVVMPLLLPDRGQSLSMNSALRRLQMEQRLREQPIHTDVYFDAGVAVPGAPWLPYTLHPVTGKEEFHGKVILLRLEEEGSGAVRWLLGAGSANLTKAGWLQNIEVWHFAEAFGLHKVPGGLVPGLTTLLAFLARKETQLAQSARRNSATHTLRRELRGATVLKRRGDAQFGVFVPNRQRFPDWIREWAPAHAQQRAEVISPYFADGAHEALVNAVRASAGVREVYVWLPHDPWLPDKIALLIQESQHDDIDEVACWSDLVDPRLRAARDPAQPRRFLHAKVLRVPGVFAFIGSVNFSNNAYFQNFEAGFLFADTGNEWLRPTRLARGEFLMPEADAQRSDQAPLPGIAASFDWRRRELLIRFCARTAGQYTGTKFGLADGSGNTVVRKVVRTDQPVAIGCMDHPQLCDALQRCTWLTLVIQGISHTVWVQQMGLEYRPLPVALTPDAWRILDLWRGLTRSQANAPSQPLESLGPLLEASTDRGEAYSDAAPPPDMFTSMALAHGSFYALQEMLAEARNKGNIVRRQYYFGADRPDTLRNLLARLDECGTEAVLDPVEKWVMLRWVERLCNDHEDMEEARALSRRAREIVTRHEGGPPLDALSRDWLHWTAAMFLCPPGAEQALAKRFLKKAQR